MSIDDYLDNLLSGSSSASRKAIIKLTHLIENLGNIMVKSTERIEDALTELDARITAIEQALGMHRSAAPSMPTTGVSAPTVPTTPTPAAPSNPVATPTVTAPAGSVSPPSIAKTPAVTASSVPPPSFGGGGGNSSVPSPSFGASTSGTTGAPTPRPSPNPLGPNLASELAQAAKSLKKVEKPASPPSGSPGGPGTPAPPPGLAMQAELKSVLAKGRSALKKINPEEIKKEKQRASAAGSAPVPTGLAMQSELREVLKKRSVKMQDREEEPSPAPAAVAPTAPKKSTKQMKESLQLELRKAFSSLLESDTNEGK